MSENPGPRAEIVAVAGVTESKKSVVAVRGRADRAPVLLVHGVFDNVWRWLTADEARRRGLDFPEARKPVPLFDVDRAEAPGGFDPPRLHPSIGMFERFARDGRSAVAYSYQDLWTPCLSMPRAVETLHRLAAWACDYFQSPRVDVVGFSRGGLVARWALEEDSAASTAAEYRRRLRRVVSVGTPFLGSSIAKVAEPVLDAIDRAEELVETLREWMSAFAPAGTLDALTFAALRETIRHASNLSPASEEIAELRSRPFVSPAGGWFALAGSRPMYWRCRVPIAGELRLPPELDAPELVDGRGDGLVAIESALGVPELRETAILPVNHFIACFDRRTHDVVTRWLDLP